jgi:hypothetical protein
MLFFPFGEKMERLVKNKVSFEMEEAIDVLLSGWRLRQFMATGQNSYRMTPHC